MTKILGFCEIARTKKEISEYIGYKNLTYMTRTFIKPLLEVGKLEYTIPEKPQSRLQKYVAKRKKNKLFNLINLLKENKSHE